jgi:hypothetical protein
MIITLITIRIQVAHNNNDNNTDNNTNLKWPIKLYFIKISLLKKWNDSQSVRNCGTKILSVSVPNGTEGVRFGTDPVDPVDAFYNDDVVLNISDLASQWHCVGIVLAFKNIY